MARTKKTSTKVRLTIYFLLLIFSISLLEIGSVFIFNSSSIEPNSYKGYSSEELDASLPFSTGRNGNECIKINMVDQNNSEKVKILLRTKCCASDQICTLE